MLNTADFRHDPFSKNSTSPHNLEPTILARRNDKPVRRDSGPIVVANGCDSPWFDQLTALCCCRIRKQCLGVAGAVTIGCFLGIMSCSAPAAADDYYAAIAFSQSNGNHGYSNNYGSRRSAEEASLSECRDRGCTVVLWFKNACGALAVGDNNAYGTGWAPIRRRAEEIAMSNCNDRSQNCNVIRWVCTTR
jgi:Domain of unknown function (DUF4189)